MKKRMEFLYRGVALLLAALLMLSDLTVIASAVVEDMESQQIEQVEQQVEETEQVEVTVCDVCGMEECVCEAEDEPVGESVEESAEEVVEEIPVEEEAMEEEAPMLFALSPMDVPVIENNGSRLVASSSADAPMYQWQISSTADGTYTDIDGATSRYYDITADDEGKYIKAVVDGVETEAVGPIGKLVEFYIDKGSVTLGVTYSGKDSDGNNVTGNHAASNIYVVKQVDSGTATKNKVEFRSEGTFDVTLAGVNMTSAPLANKAPDTQGIAGYGNGVIDVQPDSYRNKKVVTLRLKGENVVRAIRYCTNGGAANSQLKITDINGDGAVDGGQLYVPLKKVTEEEINDFVQAKTAGSYNHWNSGIGGDDSSGDKVAGLELAGGRIQVLTSYTDNCTAIGAGGNGSCTMTISGGEVIAHCSGTGAAIGGGIGWHSAGGSSNVTITGGKVYAKNHGIIFVRATYNTDGSINTTKIVGENDEYNEIIGGVAIGAGSSVKAGGAEGKVTITGGTVEAYAVHGNGIGGGNSSSGAGGKATITLGGTAQITASSIGGGDSKNKTGGEATVTVNENATVTLSRGIGGGSTDSGTGGKATITVNGGTMNAANGTIGGGAGGGDTGVGGEAKVTVKGGTLKAAAIGGGTGSGSGAGGQATVTVEKGNGTLEAASIGGGTGGATGNGGAAVIAIHGGTVRAGSIGGGRPGGGGSLGYATADITGGDISGQFLLQAAGDESSCYFNMSGGTLHGVDTAKTEPYDYTQNDGAAVYMDDPRGEVTISGGTIKDCSAAKGGAIYMSAGICTISNTATISNCNATESGGAIYLAGGEVIMEGGTLGGETAEEANTATIDGGAIYLAAGEVTVRGGTVSKNSASQNGGAIYLAAGEVTVSGGTIKNNSAANDGGAVYVAGDFTMSAGTVSGNTAEQNGGGIAVNNGKIIMSGGAVSGNEAKTGEGGGMYVSGSGTNSVAVKIYSGTVAGNSAATNGGGVSVHGGASGEITVQVGVNKLHPFDGEGKLTPFEHTEGSEGTFTHSSCPVIQYNTSNKSGGAFYVTGGTTTSLNMYCMDDLGDNKTHGDDDVLGNSMSDFLMVEGGTVYITTSKETGDAAGKDDYTTTDDTLGHTTIKGSIHIIGGVLELFGSKTNPEVQGSLTIDLTKKSDKYIDHREADGIVTISYHENFKLDGANEVTQTAFDVPEDTDHKIRPSMYAHEGYTFLGWNSKEDAKKGDDSGHWFGAGDIYTFCLNDAEHPKEGTVVGDTVYGDIVIYAIWEPNGYYVKYLPGVPDGEEWYGEIKNNGARYTYATEYKYAENGFVYPGYKFAGWSVPNKGIQQPGDTFLNLTSTQGATVPVTAQWVECEHPADKITYTVEGSTITKTCDQCKLTATATLSAEDATYDGNRHEAWLTLSNKTFWNPGEIQYAGVTLAPVDTLADLPNGGEPIEGDKLCVNAGNYTATITAPGEKSVLVEYTINKKPTPAPTNRPSYIRPESGTTLTINTLPAGERQSAVSGAYATYVVRYHKDGEQNRVVRDNTGKEATVSYTLPEALKTYTVLAYYPETENYAASSMIAADTTFLFGGDLYLTIRVDSGIDYRLTMDEETELKLRVLDGFYLVGGEYNIKKEITNADSGYDLEKLNFAKQSTVVVEEGVEWVVYQITAAPAAKRTDVSVFVGDTKRTPGMSVEVKEKEVFRDFTNTNPVTIAQDSAFTAKCTVTGYDDSVYEEITLKVPMPEGTSIILRDLGDESYWYYTAESDLASVSLDSFMRMGKPVEKYTRSGDLMLLLFVVDYADATTKPDIEKVTLSLSAGTKTGMVGIMAMPEEKKEVTLAKVSLALSSAAEPTTGLTQTVTVSANNAVAASRYDHRDVSLVLFPSSAATTVVKLPIDASVQATIKGKNATWRPNENGNIVIPLGDFTALSSSESVTLELSSDMFPVGVKQYTLSAQLYLSPTDADTSPMNGVPMGSAVSLTFTSQRDETGIKICVPNDQRLFTIGSSITAQVEQSSKLPQMTYNVNVELHWEIDNGFANTAIAPTKGETNNTYVFDLSKAQRGGNYCIVATLVADNGYVLNEARYYFILQEASEEDPTQGPSQGTNQEGSDSTETEQGTTENP